MTTMKSRGAGAAPQKYTWQSWTKGYAAWVLLLPLYFTFFLLGAVVRKLPKSLVAALLRWHSATVLSRKPDVRIPADLKSAPYMRRWWKIPRNAYFNIYFHRVLRSDDDRALHDHPWWSFSIVLEGGYYEHTILPGGVHKKVWFGPGTLKFRHAGKCAHRLELAANPELSAMNPRLEEPATTIFITGPVLRRWGFHAQQRWVDAFEWDDFCRENGIAGMKMEGYADQLEKKT